MQAPMQAPMRKPMCSRGATRTPMIRRAANAARRNLPRARSTSPSSRGRQRPAPPAPAGCVSDRVTRNLGP